MPRTLSRQTLSAPLLALLLAGASGLGLAQTGTPQSQSGAPANAQSVEPGADTPATNIPTRRGTQIDEHRDNSGQVTEVEVTAGGSHYTMKPNTPPGNAVPGSATGNSIRAPQWTVGTFDLSGKRHAAAASGTNAPTGDAPPPPPLPAGPGSDR